MDRIHNARCTAKIPYSQTSTKNTDTPNYRSQVPIYKHNEPLINMLKHPVTYNRIDAIFGTNNRLE